MTERSSTPSRFLRLATLCMTESRMLRSFRICSMRADTDPPSPNRRWKTTRGSASWGSGAFGARHDVEFKYAQLYPASQFPTWKFDSSVSSSDLSGESAPSLSAAY